MNNFILKRCGYKTDVKSNFKKTSITQEAVSTTFKKHI